MNFKQRVIAINQLLAAQPMRQGPGGEPIMPSSPKMKKSSFDKSTTQPLDEKVAPTFKSVILKALGEKYE
tara:strand:- start:119 stop:328 length:210 start_codon:yes stop_codon:yes gene_type:complete